MVYTLNLSKAICQFYLNKAGERGEGSIASNPVQGVKKHLAPPLECKSLDHSKPPNRTTTS